MKIKLHFLQKLVLSWENAKMIFLKACSASDYGMTATGAGCTPLYVCWLWRYRQSYLQELSVQDFDDMDLLLQFVIVFVIIHRFARVEVRLPDIFPTTRLFAMFLRDFHSVNLRISSSDCRRTDKCTTLDRYASPRQFWKFFIQDRFEQHLHVLEKPKGAEKFRQLFAFLETPVSHCQCQGYFATRESKERTFSKHFTVNNPEHVQFADVCKGTSSLWVGESGVDEGEYRMCSFGCKTALQLPENEMTDAPPPVLIVILVPFSAKNGERAFPIVTIPRQFETLLIRETSVPGKSLFRSST